MLSTLQENVIVLLAYDAERAPIIRGLVDVAHWGGHYRTIVTRIYDFIDKHGKPPGDHLPDILSDKLEGNTREAQLYNDVIESIHAARVGINAEYVMGEVSTFIERQSLRGVAIELAKALQRDTEESLEHAKQLIAKATSTQLKVFDPGTRLSDKKRALAFLDAQAACFPTGIPELDQRGFGPTRKELWLYIANTKQGKTWALIQLAKMALLHRVRVCHVTLEMSEERCSQRYMQAFFAMAKRPGPLQITRFQTDSLRRITGLADVSIRPKLSLDDPFIRRKLERRIDKFSTRVLDNIIVKEFPTGTLTIAHLASYLTNLAVAERFDPDLLIIDYPDLMRLDKDNYRLALDEVYKDLRGIAVKRNIAVAVVSQAHRASAKAKQVTSANVAEAYSKIAHADTVITYSQTTQEKHLGLARLHVSGGRNDADGITVVISQQYAIGSFVVDSSLMIGNYWGAIPKGVEDDDA